MPGCPGPAEHRVQEQPSQKAHETSPSLQSGLWGLHSIFLDKQLTKCYSGNDEKTGGFPVLAVTVVREPRVGTAAVTCRQAQPGSTQASAGQALLGSQPPAFYFQHTQPLRVQALRGLGGDGQTRGCALGACPCLAVPTLPPHRILLGSETLGV